MDINVSVIVVHEGKVLLMQRSLTDKYFPGAWGIPGGGMEDSDQTLEAAAIREVREELGIEIDVETMMFNNKNIHNDCLYVVFTGKLAEGVRSYSIVPSDEVNDYRWVSQDEIDDLEFTPYTKNRIVSVLRHSIVLKK